MNEYNIIDILYNYCLDNDIYFISGKNDYVNAVADRNVYEANELIMMAFFNATPVFDNGKVMSTTYAGEIGLGRKKEDTTVCSLDETFQQKHDRRLKELYSSLTNIIGDVACANGLQITNCNVRLEINQFDMNADFVTATITILDDY